MRSVAWRAALSLLLACAGCGKDTSDVAVSLTPGNPDQGIVTDDNVETGEPVAANPLGGCGMCHVDVEDEFIGSRHHAEAVGCVDCHGPSKGHAADENNEVPPDRIFARQDIEEFCEECHECSRPEARSPDVNADGQRKVCTECHQAHEFSYLNLELLKLVLYPAKPARSAF